ncbi:MAG TPA: sensor histidine kinase [Gammaproteobacteria bacterium]|nr:sensor histidine kinase [Gammaproteobacteria bacterium]
MSEVKQQDQHHSGDSFLPDFCNVRTVFLLVISAELFAFLLVLSHGPPFHWDHLGTLSLMVQLITLSSALLLCSTRQWLEDRPPIQAGLLSYIMVLLVTLLVSILVSMLDNWMRTGSVIFAAPLAVTGRDMTISAIVSAALLRLLYLQHQQRLHIETNAEARVQALLARMHPHFLFNSLNSITALLRKQPDRAEHALVDLSDLLRVSLSDSGATRSLQQEIQLAQHYLDIEALRLGERLQVQWDWKEGVDMDMPLPALSLQPLLENAVYHGIEGLQEGGLIAVQGMLRGSDLVLSVENPVPPASAPAQHRGNQMAIANIRERLQLVYGAGASLDMQLGDSSCRIELVIPQAVAAK